MRFFDEMVAHGLLVPVQALGAFGRGRVFEDVLERFDKLILSQSGSEDLESLNFPPVIDRSIIERTGYMDSFPNLCGSIHSFMGSEREARVQSLRARLQDVEHQVEAGRSAPLPLRSTLMACSLPSAWVTEAPLSIAILVAVVSWPFNVPTMRSRMLISCPYPSRP